MKQIDYQTFTNCFQDIRLVTNVPKYGSFQYRLLHRAIITNVHLKHWGKVENDLCTFCEKDRETYLHLFIFCEHVEKIW